MVLTTPVTELRGVGEAKAKALLKLGISTVADVLSHFPRAYQNRAAVTLSHLAAQTDSPVSLILKVACEPKDALVRRGMRILKFRACDDGGSVQITYFNQPYLKDLFRPGATFRFYGRVEKVKNTVSMVSPVFEVCPNGDTSALPPIVPVYPLSAGLGQRFMAQLVTQALSAVDIPELLPSSAILDNSLCTESFAYRSVHFPDRVEDIKIARRRLVFDELFVACTALAQKRACAVSTPAIPHGDLDTTPLLSLLPYEMTGAQKRCIFEISADMSGKKPMKRILCGDVGSGKTAVAAAAAYLAVKNGHQASLMAPTEILAKQHYDFFLPLFRELGFTTALLCGSMTKKEKDKVVSGLASGEISFVVGTHALLTQNVSFADMSLVITDEQHRFGVMQRAALEEKSKRAHALVMSATPIPRTLTLAKYGDLDVSRLDEMPAGRKKIGTFAVDSTYRKRLTGFIEKQVSEGHRVYVVCPAIEEKPKKTEDAEEMYDIDLAIEHTETLPLYSAEKCAADLSAELQGVRVGFAHGKMKSTDRDRVMSAFVSGELDVLVATTVVEVGINVPEATLMVVENAERFGLSQLHQLRGRVGRGDAKSWCILMSDTKNERSRKRLEIMEKCSDGFAIAEEDLSMRGPGDFFVSASSARQSGDASFGILTGLTDRELITAAASLAEETVEKDPVLEKNIPLRKRVDALVRMSSGTVN